MAIQPNLWLFGLTIFATAGLRLIFQRFSTARGKVFRLHRAGYPMLDPSWITGHLLHLKAVLDYLPPNTVLATAFTVISNQFLETGAFYMDFWPFSKPILVVFTPSAAIQTTQEYNLEKPVELQPVFKAITGGDNLFTMPHSQWKPWRSIFNPGFSVSNVLHYVPLIAQEAEVFCRILERRCKESLVFLEEDTLKFTIDVIGVVTLDKRLHYQTSHNELGACMRALLTWVQVGTEMNPLKRYNPIRRLAEWHYGRKMNRFVHQSILERYHADNKSLEAPKKYRSIMSLAWDAYSESAKSQSMDAGFITMASTQVRLFLLGGHDTTSATLIYCYHMLATHPEALKRIREEHDKVFGRDTSQTASAISKNPAQMNLLTYTIAVIKETLRLFAPASSMRTGVPGVSVTGENGIQYPTEGCNVWILHTAIHRNPRYWKDADTFLPERWLVDPTHEMYPIKGAWRPFEFGPRNCIGQSLALMEVRVALLMTVRRFNIVPAYEEFDRLHPGLGLNTVDGNRAYQVEGGAGGAHAANDFPCRVSVNQTYIN